MKWPPQGLSIPPCGQPGLSPSRVATGARLHHEQSLPLAGPGAAPPEGFEVPLEVVVARLERALGEDAMALLRKQLEFWQRAGMNTVIEEWRQRQISAQICGTLGHLNLKTHRV